MESDDVIRGRRSVRRSGDRRLDPALVGAIVDRARRASTAGFARPPGSDDSRCRWQLEEQLHRNGW